MSKLKFWMESVKLETPREVLLFRPPVRSIAPERDVTTGLGIEATTSAVRTLVAAMHRGDISGYPLHIKLRSNFICWTPSFVAGQAPESQTSQHYNATWLSFLLGNTQKDKAHDVVKVALGLLEMQERGEIGEDDLRAIYAGGVGFRIANLLDKLQIVSDLRAQHKAVSVLTECQ